MTKQHEVDVSVVGGGPAGMVLGLLLAKLGAQVLVLEQHKNFDREYRGEVLMPRFTQMMRQINLFDYIASHHHLKLRELEGFFNGKRILRIGFDEISSDTPFAIWMPQPVLLDALYRKAKSYPNFDLWFDAPTRDLIRDGSQCTGVVVEKANETIRVKSKITVGTDGRFSIVRKRGNFGLEYEDHRFDIVWFTIPKPADYDNRVRFFLSTDRNYLILPKYPESIQCGLVVSKGEFLEFHKAGIDSLKKVLLRAHPLLHSFAREIHDFSHFNVLQAKIEFIKHWAQDGLVLIGDSAHTCSPAGAIGVSVAVQSAIIGTDVIYRCLKKGDTSRKALDQIQEVREKDVREIHNMQKTFSNLLLPRSKVARALLPVLLPLSAKLGILRTIQRKMLVLNRPLEIGPDIRL